jgi:GH15 family glucan-1,4-alpha-glucosidase
MPDASIWEVRSMPQHFTHSKLMCWVGLECAAALAAGGQIPGRNAALWLREAGQIRDFIERKCWSPEQLSYVRYPGDGGLDASLIFTAMTGYRPSEERRLDDTLDAVSRELGDGPMLYRYRGEDGLRGDEGAFTACSFWMAEALVRRSRMEEAGELMEELVGLGNDLGLYAEEIDPDSGDFLGNYPQGLVHLSLVNAAVAYAEATDR